MFEIAQNAFIVLFVFHACREKQLKNIHLWLAVFPQLDKIEMIMKFVLSWMLIVTSYDILRL